MNFVQALCHLTSSTTLSQELMLIRNHRSNVVIFMVEDYLLPKILCALNTLVSDGVYLFGGKRGLRVGFINVGCI